MEKETFLRVIVLSEGYAHFFSLFFSPRERNISFIRFHYASLRVVVANREFEDSVRALIARIRVRRTVSRKLFAPPLNLTGQR